MSVAATCSILDPIYRETQTEWEASGTAVVQGTSITARPDALSIDYQTAYTYGPIATGSISAGLVEKVWRARNVWSNNTGSIVLTREGDSGGWNPELTLFTYTGSRIDELDLVFSSDGRAAIAAQRQTGNPAALSGSQIWLYWFNPNINNFTFQNFGTGSTPRVILDSPELPDQSDVLLLYVRDSTGNVYFRQQRDQYGIEYYVPVPVPVAASGTLAGELSGSLSGSFTGSGIVTSSPIFSGSLFGSLVGIFSGSSTGTLAVENLATTFSGSAFGTLSGTLNGQLTGTLNGSPFTGVSSSLSGTLVGSMTGTFNGTLSGSTVFRRRTAPFNGSFTGLASGTVNGTVDGTIFGPAFTRGVTTGYMTGSISGTYTGERAGTFSEVLSADVYDVYLEDAVKLRDNRIAIYYSLRNSLTAKWEVKRFESILYPIPVDVEGFDIGLSYITSSLRNVLVNYSQSFTESFTALAGWETGSIRTVLIPYSQSFTESFTALAAWETGSLRQVTINYSQSFTESFSATSNWETGSLRAVVIQHNVFNKDAFVSMSVSYVTSSLV